MGFKELVGWGRRKKSVLNLVKNEQEPKQGGYSIQCLLGNSKYASLRETDDQGLSEVES